VRRGYSAEHYFTLLFYASRNILAMALLELHKKENVTEAPSNCNTSGALWETGKRLFEYIRKQILPDGTTGRVAFDEMGDRIYAEYQVVNVQKDRQTNFDHKVNVGSYKYSNVSIVRN
jgi:ionotropic glutamate receptor NMDA 1